MQKLVFQTYHWWLSALMASNWTAFSALAFPVTEIQYIKRFIILFYIFGKYQELSNQKYSGCKEIQNYLANIGRQSWLYSLHLYPCTQTPIKWLQLYYFFVNPFYQVRCNWIRDGLDWTVEGGSVISKTFESRLDKHTCQNKQQSCFLPWVQGLASWSSFPVQSLPLCSAFKWIKMTESGLIKPTHPDEMLALCTVSAATN